MKFSAGVTLFRSKTDEEREKSIENLWNRLMVVENHCFDDEKKIFGGDINIVDIALGSLLKFFEVAGDIVGVKVLEDEKFPHLSSWYDNFKNVPIVKENLPEHEKMVATVKSIREKFLASS